MRTLHRYRMNFAHNASCVGDLGNAGLSFFPDGRLLLADRPLGQLSMFDPMMRTFTPIDGVPPVHGEVDGGLMDVPAQRLAGCRPVFPAAAQAPTGPGSIEGPIRLLIDFRSI